MLKPAVLLRVVQSDLDGRTDKENRQGFSLQFGRMHLGGDITSALGSSLSSGWAGVENQVTGWDWNFTDAGTSQVKYPSTGTMTVGSAINPAGPGRIVAGRYGFFSSVNQTTDGSTHILEIVTITATTTGTYLGGAFMIPLEDSFGGTEGGLIIAPISGASFTVVVREPGPGPGPGTPPIIPEPSAALLFGIGALVVVGRVRT